MAVALRRGEGQEFVLDQSFELDRNGKGSRVVMKADVSGANVPDRKYAAEIANVVWHRGAVRFMFGQERSDLKSLRSIVVVYMGPNAVHRFMDSVETMDVKLGHFVARLRAPEVPLATNMTEDSQTQSIGLRANYALMGIADEEVCLDFYQASAFAIGASRKGAGKIALDAIVRVEMNLSVYAPLHNALDKMRASLPQIKDE